MEGEDVRARNESAQNRPGSSGCTASRTGAASKSAATPSCPGVCLRRWMESANLQGSIKGWRWWGDERWGAACRYHRTALLLSAACPCTQYTAHTVAGTWRACGCGCVVRRAVSCAGLTLAVDHTQGQVTSDEWLRVNPRSNLPAAAQLGAGNAGVMRAWPHRCRLQHASSRSLRAASEKEQSAGGNLESTAQPLRPFVPCPVSQHGLAVHKPGGQDRADK